MPQDIVSIIVITGSLCGLAYIYLTVKLDQRYQQITECEKSHKNRDDLDKVRLEISQEFHDSVLERFNKIDETLANMSKQIFDLAGRQS